MAKRYSFRGRDSGASDLRYLYWSGDTPTTTYLQAVGAPPWGGPVVETMILREPADASPALLYDAYGNRPAAGIAGRIFTPSDGYCPWVDDGTVWRPVFNEVVGTAPPAAASFTAVNAAGSPALALSDDKGSLLVTQGSSGAGANAGLTGRTLPTPPYKLRVGFAFQAIPVNDIGWGVYIRDSATARVLELSMAFNSSLIKTFVRQWSSPTVVNATPVSDSFPGFLVFDRAFMHLYDPGGSGNLEWGLSRDGNFAAMAFNQTVSRNSYVANPNQLGLFLNTMNTAGTRGRAALRIFDWTLS